MPASRPIWKGQLRLSLVAIPVELFSAARSGAKPSFRQIHEPTGKPIHYEKVVAAMGSIERTTSFARLFLSPGVGHCGGGCGPDPLAFSDRYPRYEMLRALENWVERGSAPRRITAMRLDKKTGVVNRTRPLCPYPEIAAYKGVGSTDDAASFICVPQRGLPASIRP